MLEEKGDLLGGEEVKLRDESEVQTLNSEKKIWKCRYNNNSSIFSLPGWMPKASTWMPFCFAKRHSRVRIRKRHFGILTKSVEEPFWGHFRCEGNGTAARTTTLLLHQTHQWNDLKDVVCARHPTKHVGAPPRVTYTMSSCGSSRV